VDSESLLIVAYDSEGLAVNILNDEIMSINAGTAHVQVLHMAVGVSGVDVGPSASSPDAIASNLQYNTLSSAFAVSAGFVVAQVRPTGESGEPLLSFEATLDSRKGYLIVAVGSAPGTIEGGAEPELIAFQMVDYSINSRVAFVHGIPAADLTVNVIANDDMPLFRGIT
jgi:hypothetical protein